MKKTFKETIEWNSVDNKYPISQVTVLLQTNDGIFYGYWYKQDKKWFVLNDSSWGYSLNSATHLYYWAYGPKGVNFTNGK